MTVDELMSEARVGFDASIFIRHFSGTSELATDLLRRVGEESLIGFTSREMLVETCHRLMVIEALDKGVVRGNNPVRRLRTNPKKVQNLRTYYDDTQTVLAFGIRMVPPLPNPIQESQWVRERYGLLTNDSILVATLLANDVRILVTADSYFERVEELEVIRV